MTIDEILKAIDQEIIIAQNNFDTGDSKLYWAGREDALQILKAKIESFEEK